jgi:uncharacterized membrane protein
LTAGVHSGLRHRLAHLHAGTRLAIAVVASAATALLLPQSVHADMRAVASWDAFAIVALALTWLSILTLGPEQIRALSQREDPSRLVSLVLVVMGAGASLLAVLVLLRGSMSMGGDDRNEAIVLSLSAVALAWTLIHTVFTLRYAHLYYDAPESSTPLEFPGLVDLPDYLDLAYFAFIIGMTAQTADVSIHDRRIRRTALLHGVLAFAFNTSLVALIIGVLTTVLSSS